MLPLFCRYNDDTNTAGSDSAAVGASTPPPRTWTDYCAALVGNGALVSSAAIYAPQDQVLGYSTQYFATLAGVADYAYTNEVNYVQAALEDPSLVVDQPSGLYLGGVPRAIDMAHPQGFAHSFLMGDDCIVCRTSTVTVAAIRAPSAAVDTFHAHVAAMAQELIQAGC
jgi:hypothetical protein